MSAYDDFVRWYDNHIKCGGNIGTIDGDTIYSTEKQATNNLIEYVTYIRNNWEEINNNHDYYINDLHNFMWNPTSEKCRCLIQFLWMADQEIHYKPVGYARQHDRFNFHPGRSRWSARWAQKKSTEVIFLDYKLPNADVKYKPFIDVNEAWNGLTYTSHTPELIKTCSFKNILSIDDLLDTTYESDMDYYRTTDFEQLLFIDDKKDDCYAEWQQHSKKYLNECLENPIRYGSRMINT